MTSPRLARMVLAFGAGVALIAPRVVAGQERGDAGIWSAQVFPMVQGG